MINEPEDNLKGMLGKGSFAVPENYFEQLNRDIETRIIEERLKAMTASSGFTVPEFYFEELQGDVETRIAEENLRVTVTASGFTVPEFYFEALHQDVETRVAEERLRTTVTASGFTVPEFYFEHLTSKIEMAVHSDRPHPTAKIISLWRSDLFKYATAACFIMLTAFGFYFNNNMVSKPTANAEMVNEQLLFDIDEQLIIEDMAAKPTLNSNTTVSEEELEAYILSNYSTNEIAANY